MVSDTRMQEFAIELANTTAGVERERAVRICEEMAEARAKDARVMREARSHDEADALDARAADLRLAAARIRGEE